MAEVAVEDGITTIVATPHYNESYRTDPSRIKEKVMEVNQAIEERGIPLRLLPGMEAHYHYDLIDQLQDGQLLPLGLNSKYVLLELPFQQIPHHLNNLVYQIKLAGYTPIIPHPERSVFFHKHPAQLYELVKNGVITQVNAGSVTGLFGKKVKKFTKKMFDYGLLHLLASDAHDDKKRPPCLSDAYRTIAQFAGHSFVTMMKRNAEYVAYGREFWVEEPVRPQKRKFWLLGYR
ncbi:MAG: tyrosine protein phosphatase [Bacillaceae bacterium]|nr:tyrosine protein phosphatase [Bacillaceae bacterium]